MPQFDISNFTSQIFWLSICFVFIYFYAKKIFLPKIHQATNERSVKISDIENSVKDLDVKIDQITSAIENLKLTSLKEYEKQINIAKLKVKNNRKEALDNLQKQITLLQINSEKNISSVMSDYTVKSSEVIDRISAKILSKIV